MPDPRVMVHAKAGASIRMAKTAVRHIDLPSGKLTELWKDPQFLMGKLAISMAIFNSYVKLPEGTF